MTPPDAKRREQLQEAADKYYPSALSLRANEAYCDGALFADSNPAPRLSVSQEDREWLNKLFYDTPLGKISIDEIKMLILNLRKAWGL